MNMSFALTTQQVLDQSKDVTRRLGWLKLKAGDITQPVKKCMGLKPGEKVVKLNGPVRILTVRREQLDLMISNIDYGFSEVRREGFPNMNPEPFVDMFCDTHSKCTPETVITRIEFSYDLLLGWLPMPTAPLNGIKVELLIRHVNWQYSSIKERHLWQGPVPAQWIDFNGGGWSWDGMAGTPIAWRPA